MKSKFLFVWLVAAGLSCIASKGAESHILFGLTERLGNPYADPNADYPESTPPAPPTLGGTPEPPVEIPGGPTIDPPLPVSCSGSTCICSTNSTLSCFTTVPTDHPSNSCAARTDGDNNAQRLMDQILTSMNNDSRDREGGTGTEFFQSFGLIYTDNLDLSASLSTVPPAPGGSDERTYVAYARIALRTTVPMTVDDVRNRILSVVGASSSTVTSTELAKDFVVLLTVGYQCEGGTTGKRSLTASVIRSAGAESYGDVGGAFGGSSRPPDKRIVLCSVRERMFLRGQPQADFLFIIDNSDSMGEEQAALKEQITTFFTRIANLGYLDARIGILTTDNYLKEGYSGSFWLQITSANLSTLTARLDTIGTNGSNLESAAYQASRAFAANGTRADDNSPYCSTSNRSGDCSKSPNIGANFKRPYTTHNADAGSSIWPVREKAILGRASVPTAIIVMSDEGDMFYHWNSYGNTLATPGAWAYDPVLGDRITVGGAGCTTGAESPCGTPSGAFTGVTIPTFDAYGIYNASTFLARDNFWYYLDYIRANPAQSQGRGSYTVAQIIALMQNSANIRFFGIVPIDPKGRQWVTKTTSAADPLPASTSSTDYYHTNFGTRHSRGEITCSGRLGSATSGQYGHKLYANSNTPQGQDGGVFFISEFASASSGTVSSICSTKEAIGNYLITVADNMAYNGLSYSMGAGTFPYRLKRSPVGGSVKVKIKNYGTGACNATHNYTADAAGEDLRLPAGDSTTCGSSCIAWNSLTGTSVTRTSAPSSGVGFIVDGRNLILTTPASSNNLPQSSCVTQYSMIVEYQVSSMDPTLGAAPITTDGSQSNTCTRAREAAIAGASDTQTEVGCTKDPCPAAGASPN